MIKNLVFDIGGVLLSYNRESLLKTLGVSLEKTVEICNCIFETDVWQQQFDRGYLTISEVTEKLVEIHPEYEDEICQIIAHPENMPIPRDEVTKRVKILREMGYKTYYLTNYSAEFFDIHTKLTDFINYMDGGVVSAHVHYIKPEKIIYNILCEKYNLDPSECLFFDDRERNIIGGRDVGMETFLVKSEEKLIDKLDELITQRTGCSNA